MIRQMIYKFMAFAACRKYFSVLLLAAIGLKSHPQDTTLTVISHTKGAPANMKMSELKSILKGEKQRWSDNTKVTIVMMKTTTAVGQNVCEKVYGWTSDQVRRFWLNLQFAGKVDQPITVNNLEDMEKAIAENPGAIGVVDKFTDMPNIKVTTINGKRSF